MKHSKSSARILSLALSVAMVFTMLPSTVFAEGSDMLLSEAAPKCHTVHTADCGYRQAVAAVPATEGTVCSKACEGEHAADCAYKAAIAEIPAIEGTPCTHSCELCKPLDSENANNPPVQAQCSCDVLCTEGKTNAECTVCTAKDADPAACKGKQGESIAEKSAYDKVVELFTALPRAASSTVTSLKELQDTITNAKEATTITLGGDISMTTTTDRISFASSHSQNITIDLNGYTISGVSSPIVQHYGKGNLTIKDSSVDGTGKMVTTDASTDNGVLSSSGATTPTIIIEGGTISAPNGGFCIWNNGKVVIKGGTIEGTSTYRAAVENNVGSTSIEGECVIKGTPYATNKTPSLSSNLEVIASYNYDGSNPVPYNSNNVSAYKYLKVVISSTKAISFDARNGVAVADAAINKDTQKITLPTVPIWGDNEAKNNYIFAGWYTGIDGTGTEVKANTVLTASAKVYAKWTKGGKTVYTQPIDLTGTPTVTSGDGWTWNNTTKALTLDGLTIDSKGQFAIKLPADASITAEGINSLTLNNIGVDFVADGNFKAVAIIDGLGKLAVNGTGTININSVFEHLTDINASTNGINSEDELTIDGVTINIALRVPASKTGSLGGLNALNSIKIGTITAPKININIGLAYSKSGIFADTLIMDSGDVVIESKDGISLISCTLTGGVLTLKDEDEHPNVFVSDALTADGATILGSKDDSTGANAIATSVSDILDSSNGYKYLKFSFDPSIAVAAQTGAATYGTATAPTFAVTNSNFGGSKYPAFAPTLQWKGTDGNWSTTAPKGVTTSITGGTLTVNTTAQAPAGEYKFKVVSPKASPETGNYESAEATLTVDKLTATIIWTGTSFTYNGSAQAPTATVDNKVGSDVVTVTVIGGQKNVGTGITATADTLAGAAASNYKLPTTKPTQAFAIAAKTVTVTDGDLEVKKPFDNATSAGAVTSGKLGLTGVETADADNVSVKVGTVGAYADASVGKNKTVTLTISLDGSAKGNYTLDLVTTYEFKKAEITKVAYIGTPATAPESTPTTKGDKSITIKPVTPPAGENVEYAVSKTNTAPVSDSDWQTGTTFDKLDPNTEYFFFARVKESDSHAPGGVSTGISITTDKSAYTTKPTKPDETPDSKSDTGITLKTVTPPTGETLEYGIDKNNDGTITWQDSTTFSSLSPNTDYKFYTRVNENEKHKAGSASDATTIKTAKAPYTGTDAVAPDASKASKTDTTVTLGAQTPPSGETIQYGVDKNNDGNITWQDSTAFTGLTANTDYKFYARVKERGSYAAGATSAATTIKTDKVAYTGTSAPAPKAPMATKTHNSITLAPITVSGERVEYGYSTAANGEITWQEGTTFATLTANTEYFFFTRVKENDDHKAGTASDSTSIKTRPAPTTVSGSVKDSDDSSLDNVLIELKQGDTVIKSVTTAGGGNYILNNVPAGVYKLVLTKGTAPNTVVATQMITVAGTPITNQNVKFDSGNKNTVVESKPGAPEVAVGGMNDLLNTSNIDTTLTTPEKTAVGNGGSVELKFAADVKAASDVTTDKSKIEAIAGNQKIDLLLDLSVLKTVKDGVGAVITNGTKITTLADLIEVYIPIPTNLQGKVGLSLYRVHNGTAQTLSTTPDGNGEYYTISGDGESMTLYIKNFSTYALGYTAFSVTIADGGTGASGSAGYANGDLVTINAGSKTDYSFNGWTVTSGTVTLADASSASTTFTMPSENVALKANWTYTGGTGGDIDGDTGDDDSSDTYYYIKATAGVGGSISTAEKVRVKAGESAGFTITPNKGYQIADVKVNGKSIGAKKYYAFGNVRSDQTIHATFKKAGHQNPQTGVDLDAE